MGSEAPGKTVWIPFALAAALIVGALGWFLIRLAVRPACGDIASWDECEAASHCNAAHLIVSAGHEGPIWECVDR